MSDRKVAAVVSNAINGGHLPKDGNGITPFSPRRMWRRPLDSVAGTAAGTPGTLPGTNINYAFVGNPNRCLNACSIQTNGPNGNAGVDGMLSVIAHDL